MGDILKESFLHPLYKQEEVEEELQYDEDACSEGEEDEPETETPRN